MQENLNPKKLEAVLVTRKSEKKGTYYQVVLVKLSPTYEKQFFLDNADLEILRLSEQIKKN